MEQDVQTPEEENKSLTKWANPPTVRDLKQELLESKSHHDAQKSKIAEWLDNLNVRGSAVVKATDGRSKVVPKVIRKHAEWRYAALSEPFLSTEELFEVKGKTDEDVEAARQNKLVLNYQFNAHIDKVRFIDEYVRAAVDEGTVIVRTGWNFREEEVEEDIPQYEYVRDDSFHQMHQELAALKLEHPSRFLTDVPPELQEAHRLYDENRGIPFKPVLTGYVRGKVMKTVANHPTAEVCDYRNVLIDPTCYGDIDKATFVCWHFESSLSELRKDGKYKNLEKINASANTPLAEPDHASSTSASGFNFNDEARKKIVVYEYWGFWDIHKNGKAVPVVAAWVGDTMIRLEENPYPDKKIPFICEQYLVVRKNTHGEPDGVLLEDNQKIIGALTRGMIDIMGRAANGQMGTRKGLLDATNRRRFDKGQHYEYNPNGDPQTGIFMHTFPEIPVSAQFLLQQQSMEAESLTGVKAFNDGVTGASLGEVAAGVRGALDASSKREMGILRRLKNGIVKIGRKFIAMNSEFLDDKQVIRVTNEEFVEVRKDDLAGNFDLELSISTAEEDNAKASELAFMLQTLGPNEDPAVRRLIMAEIMRLRKMPRAAKMIENYQPEPDPLAQKLQELEIAKLDAEIAEIRAKTQKLMADANLSVAKVDTEEAKAENLNAQTDQAALDFVEQENGITQERELEQKKAQSEAQAQTKLLEHGLKRDEVGIEREKHKLKQDEHRMKMEREQVSMLKKYMADKKKAA